MDRPVAKASVAPQAQLGHLAPLGRQENKGLRDPEGAQEHPENQKLEPQEPLDLQDRAAPMVHLVHEDRRGQGVPQEPQDNRVHQDRRVLQDQEDLLARRVPRERVASLVEMVPQVTMAMVPLKYPFVMQHTVDIVNKYNNWPQSNDIYII